MKPLRRASLLPPEPHRSEIVRRMAALPPEPQDPSGAVLVWVTVFLLLWLIAGAALFLYLVRESPLT
jgi:hypothetical protein